MSAVERYISLNIAARLPEIRASMFTRGHELLMDEVSRAAEIWASEVKERPEVAQVEFRNLVTLSRQLESIFRQFGMTEVGNGHKLLTVSCNRFPSGNCHELLVELHVAVTVAYAYQSWLRQLVEMPLVSWDSPSAARLAGDPVT